MDSRLKVEKLRGEVDVEAVTEAVCEEAAGPPVQRLPPAEPAGCDGVRERGEDVRRSAAV